MTIASYIDHTLLKADATKQQIEKLCKEAIEHNFATVCVNPNYVSLCSELLANTNVKVCTAVGFPLGANKTAVKLFELEEAVRDGAQEIDYVINISDIKNGNFDSVKNEMNQFVSIKSKYPDLVLKVIFEVCYLTDSELTEVSRIAKECRIDFVKTSTGFGKGGATREAVEIMKAESGPLVDIKVSGGIRDREDAESYLTLGASRLGTSNGVKMITDIAETSDY